MHEPSSATIRLKIESSEPDEIREGLALIRDRMAGAGPADTEKLVELVSSLFYIDPLDRPELVPVLDEAVELVGSAGASIMPLLLDILDAGDMKAQIASSHALARIGGGAVKPLIEEYAGSQDPTRRALIIYALGKIRAPEIVEAASLVVEAADSSNMELRDTATRALGKFAETIPPALMPDGLRHAFYGKLRVHVADPNPHVRAKAVRSLGKLARSGYLDSDEQAELLRVCKGILGEGESAEWDRAYIVRKEAQQAKRYC